MVNLYNFKKKLLIKNFFFFKRNLNLLKKEAKKRVVRDIKKKLFVRKWDNSKNYFNNLGKQQPNYKDKRVRYWVFFAHWKRLLFIIEKNYFSSLDEDKKQKFSTKKIDYRALFKKELYEIPAFNKFSWKFTQSENSFFLTIIVHSIDYFWMILTERTAFSSSDIIGAACNLAKIYNTFFLINNIWLNFFNKPERFFKGYKSFIKNIFLKWFFFFCIKAFARCLFLNDTLKKSDSKSNLFYNTWRCCYKEWINIFHNLPLQKFSNIKYIYDTNITNNDLYSILSRKSIHSGFIDLSLKNYKKFSLDYLHRYCLQNKIENVFDNKKNYRKFKINFAGKKWYLKKKTPNRTKSKKFKFKFKRFVRPGYYFSKKQAKNTFFKRGAGVKAWFTRKKAKHFYTRNIVFRKFFIWLYALKNNRHFYKKVKGIVKPGDKWIRYFTYFENRISRILIWLGFCENLKVSKMYLQNNWVMVNRRIENDPLAKINFNEDIITITFAGQRFFFKKRFHFLFYEYIYPIRFRFKLNEIYSFFKKKIFDFLIIRNYSLKENFFIKKDFHFLFNYFPTYDVFYRNVEKSRFHDKIIFNIFCQKYIKG